MSERVFLKSFDSFNPTNIIRLMSSRMHYAPLIQFAEKKAAK